MEPTFRVGDLAVYPAHGVAQIVGIETREISGNKQTFYILKILENGMKIMIPTRNAGAVGLRELIRADEVDEVFEILKSREVAVEGQTWNRRYREYMEKIKTGSVFEIAEVLRDLPAPQGRQGALVRRAQDARHRAHPPDQGDRRRDEVQGSEDRREVGPHLLRLI